MGDREQRTFNVFAAGGSSAKSGFVEFALKGLYLVVHRRH